MRAVLLALFVSLVPCLALADDPSPDARVTVLPTEHIVGRRQLPGVVPVLSRARFRYHPPELERRAADAIPAAVAHPPF